MNNVGYTSLARHWPSLPELNIPVYPERASRSIATFPWVRRVDKEMQSGTKLLMSKENNSTVTHELEPTVQDHHVS